ncbi:hypothetical protein FJV76_20940 [Mesorhizobium sp. WSM4303]|uniref:hypothetical protein n=1 Tax=unclassified Mesorhizobium TaxID=325217 RepID=UPI00115C9312|nr:MULTISPECIES: hypothetical protein [unclassified Mesorhizobium]TRD01862.1 hypothetical protein FJV76_20940 [Mesorhizobium sp. WSM4303]
MLIAFPFKTNHPEPHGPGEGNAPSSGLRFRDLTGSSTQCDGKPTGHVSLDKTKETINLISRACHAKETTEHCGPVLVGSLNGDLTGVKLAAGAGCGNHIAFLVLSAVPDVAGSLPTALGRDWS